MIRFHSMYEYNQNTYYVFDESESYNKIYNVNSDKFHIINVTKCERFIYLSRFCYYYIVEAEIVSTYSKYEEVIKDYKKYCK